MKSHRALSSIALLVGAIVLCTPLQAANLGFLQYSPSAYFDDEDWSLVRAAVDDALENKKTGETVTWRNDKTGSHGEITPLETFEKFDTSCRRVRMSNEAKNIKATRLVDLCRDKSSGEWKIVN